MDNTDQPANIQRWKFLAEMVGIASIVASLIFVGLQMRQSHEIALVTLYQMRADAAREITSIQIESDALRDIRRRIRLGEEIPSEDEGILDDTSFLLLNHFENSHFLHTQGYLSQEHWNSDLNSLVRIFEIERVRRYWGDARNTFRPSYVEAVEEAVDRLRARQRK